MARDVLITPASGIIEFKNDASVDATLQVNTLGDLTLANPGGSLTIGNPGNNVYIGDGTNSVDLIFEQSGSIRALTAKTLTIGQSDSSIALATTATSTVAAGTDVLRVGTAAAGLKKITNQNGLQLFCDSSLHLFAGDVPTKITTGLGTTASSTAEEIVIASDGAVRFFTGQQDAWNPATEVQITSTGVISSSVATGTAPFTIASTTAVTNLNADLLDGNHASAFLSSSTTSTQNGYFGNIYLYDDTNPSHYLAITNASDLSAARTLSINVNNADRTISLSGDLTVSAAATVSGTNTGDQTSVTGNAGTATTLQTARNINGTSFNGSASITTASWGTARTLTIGSTGKSVDGSASVSWSITEVIPTTTNFQINSLGVGTAASAVAGEIRATNNITAYYSDERLKTRLGNIENALDKVCSLSGFYHEANETAQSLGYSKVREVGVSAQEVQAVLPEVVAPAPIDDKYLTVRYDRMVPLLIEAIKELKSEIDEIKKAMK